MCSLQFTIIKIYIVVYMVQSKKKPLKRSCQMRASSGRCVKSTRKSDICYRDKKTKRCRNKQARKCKVSSSSGRCVNGDKHSKKCMRNPDTLRCRKVKKNKKLVRTIKTQVKKMHESSDDSDSFENSYKRAQKLLETIASGNDSSKKSQIRKEVSTMKHKGEDSKGLDDAYKNAMKYLKQLS